MWYSGLGTDYRTGLAISKDGVNWIKSLLNPVLYFGPLGSWDGVRAALVSAIRDNYVYKMWYSGEGGRWPGQVWRIGYATSEYTSIGYLVSKPFDSGSTDTHWTYVKSVEFLPPNTDIMLSLRVSMDNVSWTEWTNVPEVLNYFELNLANSRYIQWKATFVSLDAKHTPILQEIEIGYLLPIVAEVDCDPDTINLKSKGRWITCYVQLPENYDPRDIDATSVLLDGEVEPELSPKFGFVTSEDSYILDHNNDGVMERLLKFDRFQVRTILQTGDEVELTITGSLFTGQKFRGSDIVRVINS